MPPRSFDRRTLLRGLTAAGAVGVATPILDVMLDRHGEAFADGAPLPRRYGVWFFAGGAHKDWQPATTGPLALSGPYAPLMRHSAQLTMVSGLYAESHGDFGTNRHLMGTVSGLSGGATRDGAFLNPSHDQVIARALPAAPRRSLEVGVYDAKTREVGTGWENISHSGPNQPNPAELDPARVYDGLFGATPAGDLSTRRRAYVDAVKRDADELSALLPAGDRQKVEAFLDGLRELEKELTPASSVCPALPKEAPAMDPEARNKAMARLVAAALACRKTQVFTFQFTRPNAFVKYPGMPDSHHNMGHTPQHPQIAESFSYTLGQFAVLLDALAAIKEGDSTLLHGSAILIQSDTSWDHALNNMLGIVAGRAGGALRGNLHVRAEGPTARLPLTLARACGADVAALGVGHGQGKEVIREILA